MTLTMTIEGLNFNEVTNVIKACQASIDNTELCRDTALPDISMEPIHVEFKYEEEKKTVFRGEDSTFSRYLNSTKKE